MTMVSFCGGRFCRVEEAAQKTAERLGCPLFTDNELAVRAAGLGPLPEGKLLAAMYEQPGALGDFTRLRPKALPQLALAMAELLAEAPLVFRGLGTHLIPGGVTHVLSVCLAASDGFRRAQAAREEELDPRRTEALIHDSDQAIRNWRHFLLAPAGWSAHEFDILLSVEKKDMASILELIVQSARSAPLMPTAASLAALEDMALAAKAQAGLAEKGYYHPEFKATACRGEISVETNKKILRVSKVNNDLIKAVRRKTGVDAVEVKMGPGYHKSDVYRQTSFVLPSKVLLVDDEREFVETLSERLQLRDIGATVVYDGAQAMESLARDRPEVVVLDLRMPGVDGLEVLSRIREQYPQVKVIVLTGHGSARDRDKCLAMGAFAFMQKPVDFEELSEVMRQAVNQEPEN